MYQIENTSAAIRELQRLLRINQTANYDLSTKTAVLSIQAKYGRQETGIVDYETFSLILDDYHRYSAQTWHNEYLFNPRFPFKEGDMGDNVGRINNALSIILTNFNYEGIIPKGNLLSKDSITASKYLRKVFNYEDSEVIDELLMNRILLELNAIQIKEKFG